MTVQDLDKLIDLIEDYGIDTPKKLIVTQETFEELTKYTDYFGGKNKVKHGVLYYRDFKIIKE